MRILLVQRTIDPPGGGNAVAAWMLQALAGVHEVTTLTERPWCPATVDAFYGTSLSRAAIPQRGPSRIAARVGALPGRLDRLRMAVLLREAHGLAERFDLFVTADNYGAFPKPGVQYLHYPVPLRPQPARLAPLVRAYFTLCDRMSGLSPQSVQANRSIANSRWTAKLLEEECGIRAEVLYPPVTHPGEGPPWDERDDRFLCIGRFDPTKRLELVMDVVERVRAQAPGITLTIVGSEVDTSYAAHVRRLAQRRSWVTLCEDLPQPELFALIRRSRYGIHAMDREHFGIAPAEMARAGCVVFGHDSGGLIEVLDARPELLWVTADDAVAKILKVLHDRPLQERLSAHLAAHARRFSSERFVAAMRELVAQWSG